MTLGKISTARPVERLSAKEMLFLAIGLAVLIGAGAAANHPAVLLGRFFWLDECLTHLIVSDPSLGHSLQALRGMETHPPTGYLILRGLCGLQGSSDETAERLPSVLFTWLMLVTVYAGLRRCFGVWPSLVALLSIWLVRELIAHTFEARFYALLTAAAAAFCLAYCRPRRGLAWSAVAALLGAVLCTIHYFGILWLGAIVMGDFVASRAPVERRLRRMLPAALGAAVLLLLLPLLREQMAGRHAATWVRPTSAEGLGAMLFHLLALPACVMFALTSVWAVNCLRTGQWAISVPAEGLWAMGGMLGLLALPVILLIFSLMVEPALIPRYALGALIGTAPLIALIASWLPTRLATVAALLLAAGSFVSLHLYAEEALKTQARWEALIDEFRKNGDNLPIVALGSVESQVVWRYAATLRPRLVNVDLRSIPRLSELDRFWVFDMDEQERVLRCYPDAPRLLRPQELEALGAFHLMDSPSWELGPRWAGAGPAQRTTALASLMNLTMLGPSIYSAHPAGPPHFIQKRS
jgi:hypothetical protein